MFQSGSPPKALAARRMAILLATLPGLFATILLGAASPALADEMLFLRIDDLATLDRQTIAARYSVSPARRWSAGNSDYPVRVTHRLKLAYGATHWLKLGIEQSFKHKGDGTDAKIGVLVPELRISLSELLTRSGDPPAMEISAFVAPRLRVNGRREPSATVGFGANTGREPITFSANAGLETTTPTSDGILTQYGPRYDVGLAWRTASEMVLSAEIWGHAFWDADGFNEQEHHFGPAVQWLTGPVRLGVSVSAGLRHRRIDGTVSDWGGLFSVAYLR